MALCAGTLGLNPGSAGAQTEDAFEFHDTHFHLTNYVQEGSSVQDLLRLMGTRVARSTLFGLRLQQMWSYANSGDFAPTYYLHSSASTPGSARTFDDFMTTQHHPLEGVHGP